MKLNVTNQDGSVEVVEVTEDTTGQQVKEKCSVVIQQNEKIRHTAAAAKAFDEGSSVDPPPVILQYKLVCVDVAKTIQDECRLGEQGVKDADKLLLLKQRSAPSPKPEKNPRPIVVPGGMESTKPEDLQSPEESAPSLDVIKEATKNVLIKNLDKKAWKEKGPSSGMTAQLAALKGKLAYRQGFMTLIELAHKLLCTDSKAAKAVKEALENAKQAAKENARIPQVDPEALKQLKDMGFPDIAARKALAANEMKVEPAMEWLLTHSKDNDYNDPLPLQTDDPTKAPSDNNNSTEQCEITQDSRLSPSSEDAPEGAANSTSDVGAGASSGAGAASTSDEDSDKEFTPDEVLQVFREFRNRPRKPPPETALHFLQRMGFSKEECMEALACNNNNTKTACDWLLGGKKPKYEELNRPLDDSSHLHQELIKNPVILMGLTKVRTLLALEHLTHSPEALEFWLTDLDVGQVLNELNQIISMDFDFENDPDLEMALEALEAQEDSDDDL